MLSVNISSPSVNTLSLSGPVHCHSYVICMCHWELLLRYQLRPILTLSLSYTSWVVTTLSLSYQLSCQNSCHWIISWVVATLSLSCHSWVVSVNCFVMYKIKILVVGPSQVSPNFFCHSQVSKNVCFFCIPRCLIYWTVQYILYWIMWTCSFNYE